MLYFCECKLLSAYVNNWLGQNHPSQNKMTFAAWLTSQSLSSDCLFGFSQEKYFVRFSKTVRQKLWDCISLLFWTCWISVMTHHDCTSAVSFVSWIQLSRYVSHDSTVGKNNSLNSLTKSLSFGCRQHLAWVGLLKRSTDRFLNSPSVVVSSCAASSSVLIFLCPSWHLLHIVFNSAIVFKS